MALYTFLNGTTKQKDLWRQGPSLMMHLPVLSLAAHVTVEFVDPGEIGQTTLAETAITLGKGESTTKVRNDYPLFGGGDGKLESLAAEAAGMGLVYSGLLHANETPVHELGHSLFASLPAGTRLKIVELFGAKSDHDDVINPQDVPWEDRITEGIAETFKEAFLPNRYRVFPNRTNKHIPYTLFPTFRKLIRGTGGSGFSYIYGGPEFRSDLSAEPYNLTRLPYHASDRDEEAFVYYEEIEGFENCWGVDMSQFAESSHAPFSIEPEEEIIGTS